jgi:diadenosine tetraphosphate (Ap4A) HIT family hydrolase
MTTLELHPRLRQDCLHLGAQSATPLLFHRNAAVPWFILVPETDRDNLLDLPIQQRDAVLNDCKRVSDYLTGSLGCAKVNIAWIGNLVPQLHVHVIGRSPDDPCWPMPVWGHVKDGETYTAEQIEVLKSALLINAG